jgi:hypothetical protein
VGDFEESLAYPLLNSWGFEESLFGSEVPYKWASP